jgi:hypothetical protein
MSEIRVQTNADKIVNKGGGIKSGSTWEPLTDEVKREETRRSMVKIIGEDGRPTMQCWRKLRTEQKTTGTDYIVFHCQKCGKRNKQSAYDAKDTEDKGSILVFRCNGCRILNEVKRPIGLATPDESLIRLSGGLLDSQGKVVR